MNILQIIHCFPPESMTGSEIYAYRLSRCLAKSHSVSVFYRINKPDEKEYKVIKDRYEDLDVYKINNTLRDTVFLDKIYKNEKIEEAFLKILDEINPDIVHIHPSANGAAIGQTSHQDFRLFCALVADLEGGAYLNFGSAVLLPEVFLKALTLARNLGHVVNNFTTANFDFIRHYRTMTNVVNRPTMGGGKGYNIIGHHELLIPLLAATLLDRLQQSEAGE